MAWVDTAAPGDRSGGAARRRTVVVRAPGQTLPDLDPAVEIVVDAREGRGPLQGMAAGLRALSDRAQVAYVSATDVPLLHPAFVRRVLGAFTDDVDLVLPRIGGHRQTLAAAYRVGLADVVEELVGAGRLRPAFLFERCRVLGLELFADWIGAHEPYGEPLDAAPMSLIYTSGTTGLPKGVIRDVMTPEQSREVAAATLAAMGLRPGMHTVVTAPMYHSAPNAQGCSRWRWGWS